MRVYRTKESTQNLCDYCYQHIAECTKGTVIEFGNGKGNDNITGCSEFVEKDSELNYPIKIGEIAPKEQEQGNMDEKFKDYTDEELAEELKKRRKIAQQIKQQEIKKLREDLQDIIERFYRITGKSLDGCPRYLEQ